MNRKDQLEKLNKEKDFDFIIIGGGATGLGCAVDAAARGFKTLLLEKHDFAKGTSSRSTKLVHGGVRYLAQGNIRLVREALIERGVLLQNAPHLCHTLTFVMPSYKWWDKWFYGIGLWIYEYLSGDLSLGKTRLLSKKSTIKHLPDLKEHNLNGGVIYYDGQFDDSRLAINLAQTAIEQGAIVVNYFGVTDFIKDSGLIVGVKAKDEISGKEYEFKSEVVINATGVFADTLLQLAEGHSEKTIAPSQGIHLIVDKHFFTGDAGMMLPKTDDGRVLFFIPWEGKVILGTTDTPVEEVSVEPLPLKEEIDFIIHHFNRYAVTNITYDDIKSVFVGLRPLANVAGIKNTAVMPRDHVIKVLPSGLVHVTGGKWTTYRNMARHTINRAIRSTLLRFKHCKTRHLRIHGWTETKNDTHLSIYGSDALAITILIQSRVGMDEKIHPSYPYTKAEIIWAIDNEMALTVEDVLSRRVRLLILDARAAIEAAPKVAAIMAEYIGMDKDWEKDQIDHFTKLAQGYIPHL
ncbi:MAG: glycerol-3-phosphate dehydrogenase/oxidase [Mariniphaga sp.]